MEVNEFLLYYELNDAFRAVITAPKLQIVNLNPRGKVVQNVKFLSITQNSNLSLKLDSTLRGMLGFQNRAPEAYKPKFHVERCNSG